MSTTVQSFTFNPFSENTFVCHSAGEAVLIDPGTSNAAERKRVLGYLEREGLTLTHLLLTHAHIDHLFGCRFFAEHTGLGWHLHPDDVPLIARSQQQALYFGVPLEEPPLPQHLLAHGDTLRFGEAVWEVRHTPGHAPGHVVFYDAASGFVIAGDVLFRGSVGRTDLPGGAMPVLLRSIFTQLMPLPDETVVYCGHGPATTIGAERRTNPFLTEGYGQL